MSSEGRAPSRIPLLGLIALALSVLGNTFYVGAWTAGVSAKLDAANEKITALQAVTYTKVEARGDLSNVEIRVTDLTRRVSNIEELRKGPR